MHATKDRPVVENGQVVVRPMNYLALSYDHRIIDGREAVLSLVSDQGSAGGSGADAPRDDEVLRRRRHRRAAPAVISPRSALRSSASAACIDEWKSAEGKPAPGGTCMNVGCIPSKALLQSSENYDHAGHKFAEHGIRSRG